MVISTPSATWRGCRLQTLLQLHLAVHFLHADAGDRQQFLQLFFRLEAWVWSPTCSSVSGYAPDRHLRQPQGFLVNRVGDFGFLLGIALVLYYTAAWNYSVVFAKATAAAGRASN